LRIAEVLVTSVALPVVAVGPAAALVPTPTVHSESAHAALIVARRLRRADHDERMCSNNRLVRCKT
jgi:hypothetical protein